MEPTLLADKTDSLTDRQVKETNLLIATKQNSITDFYIGSPQLLDYL